MATLPAPASFERYAVVRGAHCAQIIVMGIQSEAEKTYTGYACPDEKLQPRFGETSSPEVGRHKYNSRRFRVLKEHVLAVFPSFDDAVFSLQRAKAVQPWERFLNSTEHRVKQDSYRHAQEEQRAAATTLLSAHRQLVAVENDAKAAHLQALIDAAQPKDPEHGD